MQRCYGKVWRYGEYNDEEWPNGFMYLTPCVDNQSDWAHTMVVNEPMPYSTCSKWGNTKVGKRGEEYTKWKEKITNKILDRMEYKYHKKQMHYSNRLDFILKYELGNLIDMVRVKEMPFDKTTINKYYEKYISLVEK